MTEDTPVIALPADPVIDMAAAEQAKRDAARQEQDKIDMAAHLAMIAEMDARIEAEKKIAAEQDAALAAVKAECDAYRRAMGLGDAE